MEPPNKKRSRITRFKGYKKFESSGSTSLDLLVYLEPSMILIVALPSPEGPF